MKVTQVVSSLDSRSAGPSYTVPRLSHSLAAISGNTVEIATLGRGPDRQEHGVRFSSYRQSLMWPAALSKLGVSRDMRLALSAERSDVYHFHGLWMMPNVYPASSAKRYKSALIASPRGMLGSDALKFSNHIKTAFWFAFQRRAAEAVSCFHATAEQEFEDIRAFGLRQPVAIIPNGVDLPDIRKLDDLLLNQSNPGSAEPFILSLGRVHPKKGLDRLIAAFSHVAADFPTWRLRIVGPDENGHADQLKRQISNAGLCGRITIEPPVFDLEKSALMRRAELFVLPTLNDNFAMTVAESLAVETPVIATKGAPWSGLVGNECGWWVEHGVDSLVVTLQKAMSVPEDRRVRMGVKGRTWMESDFSWDRIGRKMHSVYQWVMGDAEQPGWVKV